MVPGEVGDILLTVVSIIGNGSLKKLDDFVFESNVLAIPVEAAQGTTLPVYSCKENWKWRFWLIHLESQFGCALSTSVDLHIRIYCSHYFFLSIG